MGGGSREQGAGSREQGGYRSGPAGNSVSVCVCLSVYASVSRAVHHAACGEERERISLHTYLCLKVTPSSLALCAAAFAASLARTAAW
eukprot:2305485-Rhodomonas_salina.3